MTAKKIISLLAEKHKSDVFVSECKTGGSWQYSPPRLDAWAMKKSWANLAFYGYEVKVNRSDFLRDDKWRGYLDYCNAFSFVCPHGVIQPEELPDDAGLMWASKTGSRLFTKRKAPHRDITISQDIFVYVLMWRAQIMPPGYDQQGAPSGIEYWRQWLKDYEEKKNIGYLVSSKIRQHVEMVELESNRIKAENEALSEIKERLIELGHDPAQRVRKWDLPSIEQKLNGAMSRGEIGRLRSTAQSLIDVADILSNHIDQ